MSGTIMATFKASLLTHLKANGTLSTVQVTYADPGGAQRREAVFLGDIETNNHIPESFSTGRRRRVEDFTLEVLVEVSSKPNAQACEARAVALADAVDTVLADDPQLSDLAGLMYCQTTNMTMTTLESDAPVCTIRMLIQAKARLS
jgi:hypothetical protein